MIELEINSNRFNIPQKWNQLTQDQLLRIASLSESQLSLADFKIKVLLKITGLKVCRNKALVIDDVSLFYLQYGKKKTFLVSNDDLSQVADSLNFLFDRDDSVDPPKWILSSRLSKNLIPFIETPAGVWHGPADALSNLKTGEYVRAETCLFKYHSTRNPLYLDKLIAALWRPADRDPASDDIREPFDDGLVQQRTLIAARIAPDIKQAVFLFYTGCRRLIAAKFNNASGSDSPPVKDILLQFMRLINGLSNNDVTKHEAVRQAYLMDTMVTIDEMARQQKELEAKTKKT